MTRTRIEWVAALVALAMGCGGSERRAEMPSPAASDESSADMGMAPEPAPTLEAPPPPPPVTVTEGQSTPIDGTMPTLRVTAPRANQVIRAGQPVTARIQLRNWALESPMGPHVHMIVDNEPYIAIRDVSAPIDVLAQVRENLGHELAEGTHVLRFFPSRGQHESVKSAGAFAVVTFTYGAATEGFSFDATQPLLTYSRPKGCNALGERVLLDFFVSNTELSAEGTRVHWTLDGQSGDIARWAPHYLENLGEGQHSLQLQLVAADGTPVAGPFNDTTRTFTVSSTCPH
jgi:hypothetical protein